MNWTDYFLGVCDAVAKMSKDPTTQVGSIIVGPELQIISTGYNGFPRKVKEDAERWERPNKYLYVVHAEENAIYNAARHGVELRGTTLYVKGVPAICPCSHCAKAIVQSGITTVYGAPWAVNEGRKEWAEDAWLARRIFKEGQVYYWSDGQRTE